MTELPPPPQEREKFLSPKDELLYRFCFEQWAVISNGAINSPQGYFYSMSISPDDLGEIVTAFEEDVVASGVEPTALLGHYLVVETELGVDVTRYKYQVGMVQAYVNRLDAFGEWYRNQQL